ncbi:MAG: 6-phosphofructokinase [Myxococcales bacterium]|nr:6-phosphofructokinase [Myxococcales bacterium]
MRRRIGILTGGGDCPGLNAAIRAVVKHATISHGFEVVGICDAFKGLYECDTMPLPVRAVRGLLDRGGTILGSSNRANPFAYPIVDANNEETVVDVSEKCAENYRDLGIEGLIVVGGDGTQAIAHQMMALGVEVVGIPKTIDNDLEATEYTIGYQTAVNIAVDAIDRLHSTAESHDRIMICEVMGRYAGWIAMNAGMSAGAEAILIPEVDYDVEKVIATLRRRHKSDTSFSIVVVAEGAKPRGGEFSTRQQADATQQARLGGAGDHLARLIEAQTPFDVRTTVLGHVQRGGTPSAFDRLLATRFGVAAVELLAAGQYGRVAAYRGGEIVDVAMEQAVAKLKRVRPDGPLVTAAQALGIELGF